MPSEASPSSPARRRTRYGCLALLLAFSAVIAPMVWFARDPGKSSAIAVGGAFALVFIYLNNGIDWLNTLHQRKPPGPPGGEA